MSGPEFTKTFLRKVIDIWVYPRIKELQNEGKLPKSYVLKAAQIVFNPNSPKVHVRLNSQVKCVIKAKVSEEIHKNDPIYEHQIKDIISFEIPKNRKNQNYGLITLVKIANRWYIHWDARYNKQKISEHIKAAKEFYETAKWALSRNYLRAFFENCFASAELSTHALVLILPQKIIKEPSHKATLKGLRLWSNLGNIDIKYLITLEKLNSLRASARYMASKDYLKEDANKIVKAIEDLINFVATQIK